MKLKLIALLLFIQFSSFAQSVYDYQYVIIPEKYDFSKYADEYEVNSLTKFLFNKYGFDSYRVRDEKPFGLENGSCNALHADVESKISLFRTTVKVILKDCNGDLIFESIQGSSKNKDYKKSYHEALRKAFISIEELKYSYNGKSQENSKNTKEERLNENEVTITEEIVEVKELEITEPVSLVGTYQSSDGFYSLVVKENNLSFFEGKEKIGSIIKNNEKTYEVLTTQFNGKGYFKRNAFIVDRVVKGVGVVQMVFSKTK